MPLAARWFWIGLPTDLSHQWTPSAHRGECQRRRAPPEPSLCRSVAARTQADNFDETSKCSSVEPREKGCARRTCPAGKDGGEARNAMAACGHMHCPL